MSIFQPIWKFVLQGEQNLKLQCCKERLFSVLRASWSGWGGKGPLEILLQPLSKQAKYSRVLRAMLSQHLSISKNTDSTTSLGSLCQCLIPFTVNYIFLMFKWIFLYFKLCSCLFITSLGTTGKSLVPSSLLPIRNLYTLSREVTSSYRLGSSHELISLLLTADFSNCAQHQSYYC